MRYTLVLVIAATLALGAASHAQTRISRHVLGSGGIEVSATSHGIRSTVGQIVVDVSTPTTTRLASGFWYGAGSAVTHVTEPQPGLPVVFSLRQNSPNPFAGETSIRFDVPASGGRVFLRIYDIEGRLVRTLVDGRPSAGHHQVYWNGRDGGGRRVAPGIYFCIIEAPAYQATRKMTLLH